MYDHRGNKKKKKKKIPNETERSNVRMKPKKIVVQNSKLAVSYFYLEPES